MTIIKLNIPCVWGGTLAGILLRNQSSTLKSTTKIVGIHGWLDNLHSLLPLAQKLIDHHPSKFFQSRSETLDSCFTTDYEIYLYDRAGHGFSSHLPKGSDYSNAHNLQDLRQVIQSRWLLFLLECLFTDWLIARFLLALGWKDDKLSIIGHSYGAMLGMVVSGKSIWLVKKSSFISISMLPVIRLKCRAWWQLMHWFELMFPWTSSGKRSELGWIPISIIYELHRRIISRN